MPTEVVDEDKIASKPKIPAEVSLKEEAGQPNEDVIDFLEKYAGDGKRQTLQTNFADISSLNKLSNIVKADIDRFNDCFTLSAFRKMNDALKDKLQNQGLKNVMLTIDKPNLGQKGVMDIKYGKILTSTRNPPILVMGGSGSGKTMFSYAVLQNILQGETFYVYMHANTAFDNREKNNAGEVGEHMHAKISNAIRDHGGTDAEELTLIVIVDEVGIAQDKKYVGTTANLLEIKRKLLSLAKEVRLVLSGTGLDQITTYINSDQDSIKIRLKPWSKAQVRKFVSVSGYDNSEQLVRLIWSTPLYKNLASNPRALSYLVQELDVQQGIYGNDMINADFVVTSVAGRYIGANGLATLDASERRLVAMLVWKALADAKYNCSKEIDLRDVTESEKANKIEACCHSLVDINLESDNGTLKLIKGEDYAVSITSAISIVLFAMTGNVASLCRNWEEFETVAALHELQLAYVTSYPQKPPQIKIVVSRTQFPGREEHYFRVPQVEQDTIVINGPKAEYADVISLNRLVQAKHQEEGGCYTLDLKTELKKMGVTKGNIDKKKTHLSALEVLVWVHF